VSDDLLGDKLKEVAAMAAAEAWQQREEFFRAVGQAFRDGETAQQNIAYALGRWGEDRAIEMLQETGRIGHLRGRC
jgi:hypothetical protein